MERITGVGAMRAWGEGRKGAGRRIGFVPTMGCLHEGHLALMETARRLADDVVVSIFVNPAQFGPGEDFERYPRKPDKDMETCQAAGVAAVFMPSAGEMYVEGASVFVDEKVLSNTLCGRSRPGHFRGVLTVVAKLFNIIEPEVAVFGWKDLQQAILVKRMVRDLNFDVTIELAPIVRETDGLAMSSRNRYLIGSERKRALALKEGLDWAKRAWHGGETRSAAIIREIKRRIIEKAGVKPEYVACVDSVSLEPVDRLKAGDRIALAVSIGQTRLIDNVRLGEDES